MKENYYVQLYLGKLILIIFQNGTVFFLHFTNCICMSYLEADLLFLNTSRGVPTPQGGCEKFCDLRLRPSQSLRHQPGLG